MSDHVPTDALAYLATPYSKSKDGLEDAFVQAARLAALLMRAGVKVYSPIAHTHPLAIHGQIDPLDHSIWLPFDQAMMSAAQVLIVAHMEGWQDSKGVAHEIEFFTKARKSIFDLDPTTLTMVKRKPKPPQRRRFEDMSIEELREERDYWDGRIREADGVSVVLRAADEFRAMCDSWIERREAERALNSQVTEGRTAGAPVA